MNYCLGFFIFILINLTSYCSGNYCKNVSRTLYVINGGNASTDFYSDEFLALRCYCNNNMVFNNQNVSPSSRFQLQQSNNLFTIVISNVTKEMNETYRCLVLENLCRYNIIIRFETHVDEVQLYVFPAAPTIGNKTIDVTNGYVVLKCQTTTPYPYTILEFRFDPSMDAHLIHENVYRTTGNNLYHVVKILALNIDATHDGETIFCSADHQITTASINFTSAALKVNTYRCQAPEPIRSLSIGNVTANSLIIEWEWTTNSDCSWIIFVVECITPLPSIWSEPIEIESSNSSQKHLVIDHLIPGIEYGFVFYARNPIGQSRGSFIFSTTKDTHLPQSSPLSYESTKNEIDFTTTEIALIMLAFLVGCIFAGCLVYIIATKKSQSMKKTSQNNNLDSTNYQTSIVTHVQNPIFEQPLRTTCDRTSNEYNMTSIYQDIGKYDTTIQRSAAAASASGARCRDFDDDCETYQVIKDQNLVYHSVY